MTDTRKTLLTVFFDDNKERKLVTEHTNPLTAFLALARDATTAGGFPFVSAECHLDDLRQWQLTID